MAINDKAINPLFYSLTEQKGPVPVFITFLV